jgi:hypothetical protein
MFGVQSYLEFVRYTESKGAIQNPLPRNCHYASNVKNLTINKNLFGISVLSKTFPGRAGLLEMGVGSFLHGCYQPVLYILILILKMRISEPTLQKTSHCCRSLY